MGRLLRILARIVRIYLMLAGALATLWIGWPWILSDHVARHPDAHHSLAEVQIDKVCGAIDFYRLDNGRYPSMEQGLDALVRAPNGGYVREKDLVDPWGARLEYALEPGGPVLRSIGSPTGEPIEGCRPKQ